MMQDATFFISDLTSSLRNPRNAHAQSSSNKLLSPARDDCQPLAIKRKTFLEIQNLFSTGSPSTALTLRQSISLATEINASKTELHHFILRTVVVFVYVSVDIDH